MELDYDIYIIIGTGCILLGTGVGIWAEKKNSPPLGILCALLVIFGMACITGASLIKIIKKLNLN